MAHKTFISYKWSESQSLRDKVIRALGSGASYYQGETSDSPDLTDTSTDNIKRHLRDMIYDTSVTIVIISPNMIRSKWIDWEIEYSLKKITRNDRTSQPNGVVGVVMKVNGSYDWLISQGTNYHGKTVLHYDLTKVYPIIKNNKFNSKPAQWHCNLCRTYDYLNGSYIAFVEEENFLSNPWRYINNAYDKSQNDAVGYELVRQR